MEEGAKLTLGSPTLKPGNPYQDKKVGREEAEEEDLVVEEDETSEFSVQSAGDDSGEEGASASAEEQKEATVGPYTLSSWRRWFPSPLPSGLQQ